jgi:glycosyltransferase involved in cell wall biosynthesis
MDTLSSLLGLESYTIIKSSSKLNKLIRLLDMCFAVIKHRNRIDYILIDTFSTINFYYAFFTSQIARLFKIKYIPILHGGNLPYRLSRSKNLSNLIFRNSFANVAPSNYLKNEFESKGYKTTFIPNVIEIDDYKYKKREKIMPNLLWVRAFKQLYNPAMAISVLYLVRKEFPMAKLCMIGPLHDNSFNETKALVKKYNLEKSVEFTGVLPKELWHKKSEEYDFFINTTNFDNTPVSVVEAMALGLTVVSTNVGGMPYLLDNCNDGLLVEKDNEHKMAEAIIEVLKSNNQQLSKNARIKAENFRWDLVKVQWFKILN